MPSTPGDQARQHWRTAGMKGHALILDLDLGIRIDGQGHRKNPREPLLEMERGAISSAVLRLQRSPRHKSRLRQRVKPVGQPQVAVQGGAVVAKRPDRRLFHRDGMPLQSLKKPFAQSSRLKGKPTLSPRFVPIKEQGSVHDRLVD